MQILQRYFGSVLIAIGVIALLLSSCRAGGEQGRLIVSDDFSDPASGWRVENSQKYSAAYIDGSYVLTVKTADFIQLVTLARSSELNNFVIEVETNNIGVASDNSSSGIIFGYRDWENYEVFLTRASDGYYCISKHMPGGWSALVKWTKSSSIKPGKEINVIKIRDLDGQITLYANGSELVTVDESSSIGGQFGLLVMTSKSAPSSYAFDNFRLYQLSSSVSTPVASSESALLAGKNLTRINEDDFSMCDGSWACNAKNASLTCADGVLNMVVNKAAVSVATNQALWEPSDFVLEIDVKKVAGGVDSDCGVEFRFQQEAHYYYGISGGQFLFRKMVGSKVTHIEKWRASSFIKPDSEVNRLKVICLGKRIELYANGNKLGSYIDTSSDQGWIFLVVEAGESADSSYNFDNFKFYKIE